MITLKKKKGQHLKEQLNTKSDPLTINIKLNNIYLAH